MDDDDGWQLLPKPPKRVKKTCFEKCIFCQMNNDVLRTAKPSSIEKVIFALELRQDEISQRLSPDDLRCTVGKKVLWHSSCYETYTSKQNLRYCEAQSSSGVIQPECRQRRKSFDWSKSFLCKNATWKRDRKLINIATFEACNSIKESAEAREDHELLSVLQTVNYDLIAAEGKYHKACHASYISKVNIKHKQRDASIIKESTFDEAFNRLVKTITPEVENGKAYDMNGLLVMFKREMEKLGNDSQSYTKQKLKVRLMSHFEEQLVFHQPPQQSKPEIVYSSSISLIDVINAASDCPLPDTASSMTTVQIAAATSNLLDIYSVAFQIRQDIMKCKGIEIKPLNIGDLQLDIAKALLPQSLYWLVRWIVTGEQYSDSSPSSASNTTDERKIILCGQDLVHCASHARVKLPKHVGLAMSVKHLTSSKQLITLLNRMGHCSSYEEIEQVETSLVNENLARADLTGVLIPTNISPGAFIQMAADNNDINEETIDGKNNTRYNAGYIPAQAVRSHASKGSAC